LLPGDRSQLSRETYRSSGRVDWGRLAVGLALSLPLALLAGVGL
jgi:hypothetical protein